jgi:hypothetical protein
MGTRPTKKAGIYKPRRVTDPEVMRAINAIIERLEVLDGIRGDNLDQAVTWRDLGNTGFTLGTGAGGAPTITNTPGPGTGGGGVPVPEIGPAGPPSNLAANETYLALLLTWDNTDFNLQHVEVWRASVDNLSTAVMVGTTVSPQFVDYVGASASYYYWVRSVGTDGTKSAFNDTAGTLGTTGVDPGNLTIDPRFFTLEDGTGTELPFLTDGSGNIGIDGDLIANGTVRALSIVADSIGAREISTDEVSGIFASFGTMQGGLIRTAAPSAFRVEIEDQASTFYPLWYGSGAKGPSTGLFYVTQNGDVVVRGLLDAGMIRQSYFTPASSGYDPFKIACSYPSQPSSYSGGQYTGKEAHLFPVKVLHMDDIGSILGWYPIGAGISFYSDPTEFLGPLHSSTTVYGRVGTYAELFWMTWSFELENIGTSPTTYEFILQYRYNGVGGYTTTSARSLRHKVTIRNGDRTYPTFTCVFKSKTAAWNTIDFRLQGNYVSGYNNLAGRIHWFTSSIHAPNFGVSDAGGSIPTLS